MESRLSKRARQVQDFIREKGFEFSVRELPESTRTADEAARAVGCDVGQIAKSLVFLDKAENCPVLVIASGKNRVSLSKVQAATGRALTRADGKLVKQRVGFAIGGIPPAGHNEPLFTVLDPDLKAFNCIWAAAGTPNALFELNPLDLEPLTDGVWVELAE